MDLICIQEPYVGRGILQDFPMSHEKITIGDSPGAAVIITNKEITSTTIYQLSNPKVLCIEIKHPLISFILINMYFQYKDPIEPFIEDLENNKLLS